VNETEALAGFIAAFQAKYAVSLDPADPSLAVFRVRVRQAFAWGEHDFPQSATRWRF